MKKLFQIITFLMLLSACETIIDLDIDFDDSKMGVNAVFRDQRNAGDSTIVVWISDVVHPLSKKGIRAYLVKDASVALFENGQFVENLKKVEYNRIVYDWRTGQIDTVLSGYFKSEQPLEPGKTYKVVANHPGKKEVSHTYTHVPRVIPSSVKLTNPATGEVTITFDNPEGVQTFLISLTAIDEDPSSWDWEEFICLDPNFQAFVGGNFDPLDPETPNTLSTRFGFYVDNTASPVKNQTIKLFIQDFEPSILNRFRIEFGAVSESFPRYIASYFAYNWSDDNFFSTPEPIFGNSSNGIGVSIGSNTGKYNIQP